MRKNVSKLNKALALALSFVMLVGTMAYFTDRVSHNASYTTADASTIIDVTTEPEVDPDDPDKPDPDPDYDPEDGLEQQWKDNNPDTIDKPIAPGDKADLDYTLTNLGDPIDVRQTFILTSTEAMNLTEPEFRLFADATADAYGANVGGTVISKEVLPTEDNKFQVKYEIAPFTMETNDSVDMNYVVVFDKYASNAFQGAKCTIDYLVEMRQHIEGTDAGSYDSTGWTDILTATTTFGGDANYKTVPKA